MTIIFQEMSQNSFLGYKENLIRGYAQEKVKAGTWLEEESLQKAIETTERLLPQGINTPNHHMLDIVLADSNEKIGMSWLHFDNERLQKEAFIYDFFIEKDNRDKGFGTAALNALEEYVRALGAKKLSLHVFGHNERAVHLYQKVNFQITDLVMSKELEGTC